MAPALVWKRLLAFIIDIMIINFVILFPFRRLFQKIVPSSLGFKETFEAVNAPELNSVIVLMSIFSAILMVLYFVLLEGKLRQSIGKILTGIYVVGEAKELRLWQLLVRNLFLVPFFPFILLWVVDPAFMLLTKDNKRLSEILSKTRVVERIAY
jgi:uncharacterized RDD family membrane protein YckC